VPLGVALDVPQPNCADAAAMQTKTAAISLELSVDGESIVGRASDEAGIQKEFSGWLGLVSAVEALITPDSQGEDE
jgi:hypothetical protein